MHGILCVMISVLPNKVARNTYTITSVRLPVEWIEAVRDVGRCLNLALVYGDARVRQR